MSYKALTQLKEGGFSQEIKDGSFYYVLIGPQKEPRRFCWGGEGEDKPYGEYVLDPGLSELIDACGEGFDSLDINRAYAENFSKDALWWAYGYTGKKISCKECGVILGDDVRTSGKTRKEAMRKLWLKLNK